MTKTIYGHKLYRCEALESWIRPEACVSRKRDIAKGRDAKFRSTDRLSKKVLDRVTACDDCPGVR